jgi:hypothetical protein
MNPRRDYPLRVEWQTVDGRRPTRSTTPPVVVRPFIPGALVTPAEQTLDPSATDTSFSVTPLALGTMRDARVDLIPAHGAQTAVTLPLKLLSQRLTKFLLLLTFLVPVLLLCVKYMHLEAPPEELKPSAAASQSNKPSPPSKEGFVPKEIPVQDRAPSTIPRSRGKSLEYYVERNLPHIPNITKPVAEALGDAYLFLDTLSDQEPLAFYIAIPLVLLTGTSWLAHRSARGRRRSSPLTFARPALEGSTVGAVRTHPGQQPDATVVEPIEG